MKSSLNSIPLSLCDTRCPFKDTLPGGKRKGLCELPPQSHPRCSSPGKGGASKASPQRDPQENTAATGHQQQLLSPWRRAG